MDTHIQSLLPPKMDERQQDGRHRTRTPSHQRRETDWKLPTAKPGPLHVFLPHWIKARGGYATGPLCYCRFEMSPNSLMKQNDSDPLPLECSHSFHPKIRLESRADLFKCSRGPPQPRMLCYSKTNCNHRPAPSKHQMTCSGLTVRLALEPRCASFTGEHPCNYNFTNGNRSTEYVTLRRNWLVQFSPITYDMRRDGFYSFVDSVNMLV